MNVRRQMVAGSLVLAVFAVSQRAECAPQAKPRGPQAVQAAPSPQPVPPVVSRAVPGPRPEAADQTRRALRQVLAYYSPNLGRVLALDPLLLQNPTYLEPYPDLAAFLAQHPEVARNGAYYLSEFRPDYYTEPDRDTQIIRMWNGMFEGFFLFLGFAVITGSLIWLVKTIVDYRRWNRLSKVQTEAHNKLLDRFTANEELLAYINTASGKRFLESAPIALNASASVATPLRRILWAVEVGVVLACGAGGILIARFSVPAELMQPMSVAGIFVVSLGIGFILAAGASYVISRRLGVLSPAVDGSGHVDAPPAA